MLIRLHSSAWALSGILLLAGCGDHPAKTDDAREIRGAPILASHPTNRAEGIQPATGVSPNTAAAAPAPAPAAVPGVARTADGYQTIGFEKLAGYPIEVSDELLGPVTNNFAEITARTEALIPETIKALNQQRVELKGFMLPLKLEGGLVTEMLIMKDQSMCCFGVVPKIHEWVSVKMTNGGVKPIMDQAVRLAGTLHVGESRENGYLVGIYRLDGDKLAGP